MHTLNCAISRTWLWTQTDRLSAATEPFDEALDRDIWSLDTERVESEIELGNLRKDRPAFLYKKESELENRKLHAEWFPEDDEEASQGEFELKAASRIL